MTKRIISFHIKYKDIPHIIHNVFTHTSTSSSTSLSKAATWHFRCRIHFTLRLSSFQQKKNPLLSRQSVSAWYSCNVRTKGVYGLWANEKRTTLWLREELDYKISKSICCGSCVRATIWSVFLQRYTPTPSSLLPIAKVVVSVENVKIIWWLVWQSLPCSFIVMLLSTLRYVSLTFCSFIVAIYFA